MITPVANAIGIFRSQIERCIKANEENFLLELQRLVAISNGNSHIQRCVFEIDQDANNWAVNFQKKETEALNQIMITLKKVLFEPPPRNSYISSYA